MLSFSHKMTSIYLFGICGLPHNLTTSMIGFVFRETNPLIPSPAFNILTPKKKNNLRYVSKYLTMKNYDSYLGTTMNSAATHTYMP